MNADIQLIESVGQAIALDDDEVAALTALGRELASSRRWWGATGEPEARSVIDVASLGRSLYRVTFKDVIGVIRLGFRQFHVMPKIPVPHFLYLASRCELAPRRTRLPVHLDRGMAFMEMLCDWCIGAAEELLRSGIRRDYAETSDTLDYVQGRIDVLATSEEVLMGRPKAVCHFDVLSEDMPLNRVIRAACERISRTASLTQKLRQRAREVAYRMDDVGPLQSVDLRAKVDRLTVKYTRAIPLAHLVLSGCGLSHTKGIHTCTAFLLRTPEMIEDALRSILKAGLPEIAVAKCGIALGETGLSMNPDLVFGAGVAVGDVKYRHLGHDWARADLNQVVAFATAFHAEKCAVFAFSRDADAPLPRQVPVGHINAKAFGWVASDSSTPEQSAKAIVRGARLWLGLAPEALQADA